MIDNLSIAVDVDDEDDDDGDNDGDDICLEINDTFASLEIIQSLTCIMEHTLLLLFLVLLHLVSFRCSSLHHF